MIDLLDEVLLLKFGLLELVAEGEDLVVESYVLLG